jgi:hypothetical protein
MANDNPKRINSSILWIVALAITLGSAVWQRRSGPTYPTAGEVVLEGSVAKMKLLRSSDGEGGLPVSVSAQDIAITAQAAWRRFPTNDAWEIEVLHRSGDLLVGELPHQPPAGKLEYQIRLRKGDASAVFPPRPAIARFKGSVPPGFLIPHVFIMFLAMLVSNRAGLEALRGGNARRLTSWTLLLIIAGGLILGPIVQKYAFGEFWTGIPFGWDLTDNKTLVAAISWVLAWLIWMISSRHVKAREFGRWMVLGAAVVTLIIFVIPHSVWGSQIDWSKLPKTH